MKKIASRFYFFLPSWLITLHTDPSLNCFSYFQLSCQFENTIFVYSFLRICSFICYLSYQCISVCSFLLVFLGLSCGYCSVTWVGSRSLFLLLGRKMKWTTLDLNLFLWVAKQSLVFFLVTSTYSFFTTFPMWTENEIHLDFVFHSTFKF